MFIVILKAEIDDEDDAEDDEDSFLNILIRSYSKNLQNSLQLLIAEK